MVNDPIGDMLIQIKNAGLARKKTVILPYSNIKLAVATILTKEGYLVSAEKTGVAPKHQLKLVLKYEDQEPVITDVKRKSKPGLRIYVNKDAIQRVVGGLGIAIISTPKGIMTGAQAKKAGIGGELLCEIW